MFVYKTLFSVMTYQVLSKTKIWNPTHYKFWFCRTHIVTLEKFLILGSHCQGIKSSFFHTFHWIQVNYMFFNRYQLSHSRVSMIFDDNMVSVWRQDIGNYRDNITRYLQYPKEKHRDNKIKSQWLCCEKTMCFRLMVNISDAQREPITYGSAVVPYTRPCCILCQWSV